MKLKVLNKILAAILTAATIMATPGMVGAVLPGEEGSEASKKLLGRKTKRDITEEEDVEEDVEEDAEEDAEEDVEEDAEEDVEDKNDVISAIKKLYSSKPLYIKRK